jgi:hypothetical protein
MLLHFYTQVEGTGVFNIARPRRWLWNLVCFVMSGNLVRTLMWASAPKPSSNSDLGLPESLDYRTRHGSQSGAEIVLIHFLPAAINEVDGLRHWNDNSPPFPPLPPRPSPPTICDIFKLFFKLFSNFFLIFFQTFFELFFWTFFQTFFSNYLLPIPSSPLQQFVNYAQ